MHLQPVTETLHVGLQVRNKGGIVIIHSLSFKEKMISAVKDPLYSWQVTTWLATFSYFDIGLVADKLRALAAGAGADLANVRPVPTTCFS